MAAPSLLTGRRVLSLALAFLPFALTMSVTPGPNNFMVASSGVNGNSVRTKVCFELAHAFGAHRTCRALGLPVPGRHAL